MKTTMLMRPIANPRRTTLAHLQDAAGLTAAPEAEPGTPAGPLPARTANPRRTKLDRLPGR